MDSVMPNNQRSVISQWVRLTHGHELVYCVTRSELFSDELGRFVSFGVGISDRSSNVCTYLEDISPDRNAVLGFAKRCSDMEVFPEHLQDTAENFLAGLYSV